MMATLPPSWRPALGPVMAREEVRRLAVWLAGEAAAGKAIYPSPDRWVKALELTPLEDVRVVILGQDPYHGPGQAMGLSFSVPAGLPLPPSLRNIHAELASDLGVIRGDNGDLSAWARQGVLLLNTSLTVEAGRAASHAGKGWELVSNACLAAVAAQTRPSVFILWGNHAQGIGRKTPLLHGGRHLVIETAHPSPLSARRGFFGSRPFSRANEFLRREERGAIDWSR
ncbi:uracil-DNA glycosylase [Qipengyuania sp.]|uniref:uracil-DNA glycosylase n=1 Tax=Qipengyuania sp. TaxID=2004515 RepID=UPI0037358DC7